MGAEGTVTTGAEVDGPDVEGVVVTVGPVVAVGTVVAAGTVVAVGTVVAAGKVVVAFGSMICGPVPIANDAKPTGGFKGKSELGVVAGATGGLSVHVPPMQTRNGVTRPFTKLTLVYVCWPATVSDAGLGGVGVAIFQPKPVVPAGSGSAGFAGTTGGPTTAGIAGMYASPPNAKLTGPVALAV